MVCWTFDFKENYKGAYTAHLLNLDLLRYVFKDGTIVADFNGLQGIQTILALIEIFGFSRQQLPQLSSEEGLKILEQLSELLTTWKPLRLVNSVPAIQQIWSLNLPNCLDVLLNSIVNATHRLVNLLEQSKAGIEEESYLLHLAIIREQMERIRKFVTDTFSSHPPFPADQSSEFHFKMVNFDEEDYIFVSTNRKLLQLFAKHGIASHMVAVPMNSQIAAKIKQTSLSDLIRDSTATICPICHDGLDGGQNLSFLIECNHICCSHCMEKWFDTVYEKEGEW